MLLLLISCYGCGIPETYFDMSNKFITFARDFLTMFSFVCFYLKKKGMVFPTNSVFTVFTNDCNSYFAALVLTRISGHYVPLILAPPECS